MGFNYYMTQRPPMPGAMPKDGLTDINEYDQRLYVDAIDHDAYARLTYSRKLTAKEVRDYELVPTSIAIEMSKHEVGIVLKALELMADDDALADDAYLLHKWIKEVLKMEGVHEA